MELLSKTTLFKLIHFSLLLKNIYTGVANTGHLTIIEGYPGMVQSDGDVACAHKLVVFRNFLKTQLHSSLQESKLGGRMIGYVPDRPTIPVEDNIIDEAEYLTDAGESETNPHGDDATASDWDASTLSMAVPPTPQRDDFASEAAANGAYPGYTPLRNSTSTSGSFQNTGYAATFQSPPPARLRRPQFNTSVVDNRARTPHRLYTAQSLSPEDDEENSPAGTNFSDNYGPSKYWASNTPQPSAPLESPSVRSASSAGSRRLSTLSHRSSTSMSLLFGEVINLENRATLMVSDDSPTRPDSPVYSVDLENQFGSPGDSESGIMLAQMSKPRLRELASSGVSHALFLGEATIGGIRWLAAQGKVKSQQILQGYRHPAYPRVRSKENLKVLQEAHKKKVVELSEDAHIEEHYDFAILLQPQEAYSYWAELLDFRTEHLGEEMMDPVIETASTNSTETRESDDDDEEEVTEEFQPLRRPHQYSTPLTGFRRRARTTAEDPMTPADHLRASTSTSSPMPRVSLASTWFSPSKNPRSGRKSHGLPPSSRVKQRMSMFQKAVGGTLNESMMSLHPDESGEVNCTPAQDSNPLAPCSTVRRRWGNRTQGSQAAATLLSPPVRSLTRGDRTIRKIQRVSQPLSARKGEHDQENDDDEENADLNSSIQDEETFPNPVIPRGIAARTNGMLPFLSALNRGVVVRRHRPNKDPIYCKISSEDGGDTIQYQIIETEEALVAFREQRMRYNRKAVSNPDDADVKAMTRDWACAQEVDENDAPHNFNVPDHVAAARYREKVSKDKRTRKNVIDLATKAANSGVVRAADIVAVHPASHLDPRNPGKKRGDLGTSSLRKSKAEYHTPTSFSIVVSTSQRFAQSSKSSKDNEENKWYSGEGNELNFKVLDFEAATEGEYWLIFRGFLLLHRDVAVGRFAAERRAGIGGGGDVANELNGVENCLHKDEFVEPTTVGCIERAIVRLRKLDTTYMTGAVAPTAVPPPSDYFLGFKSPGTQIWSRLRLAGLETARIYAVDKRRVMIKIRCPEDRLTDVAEVLRVMMTTHDGVHIPFREDTTDLFKPVDDWQDVPTIYQGRKAALLRSKDRQSIINFIIGSRIRDSGAELGPNTDVGKMVQARVPLHMHAKLESLFQPWVFYWRVENWTDNSSMIEPEDYGKNDSSLVRDLNKGESFRTTRTNGEEKDKEVPSFFTRFFVGAFYQPLDSIEEYFGEQVTFYFAWLQHCARHLVVLTAIGLLVSIFIYSSNNVDHPIRPYFSMVVMLWTFMVLINWKKRSNLLAYKWGSMDYKVQETTRPEFHGEYVLDEITNEWVVKYPNWKRWLKYMISVPITMFFTGAAVVLILLIHKNRDRQMACYINQKLGISDEHFRFEFSLRDVGQQSNTQEIEYTREIMLDPGFWIAMGALPALLGLSIPLMNFILTRISVFLNNFENYRTESEYRTNLIIKVFSFRFVSQFGTLYYYAVISMGDTASIHEGIVRMGTSVMIYTTVAHWWSIFLQVYIFMFVRNVRRFFYRRKLYRELQRVEMEEDEIAMGNLSDAEDRQVRLINKRMLLDQAQDEVWLEVMNPAHDSFPEYISAVVQFSFVACFSIVLPMTPLFCLVNYLLSMRYDAYKLCRGRRRPLAKKTGGIGVWEHLLHIVAVIAVLTNCWLIAFTTESFTWIGEEIGDLGLFTLVVAWEHVMLLIKYVLQTSISPFPRVVRDHLKREQHRQDQEQHTSMRMKDFGRRGKTEKKEITCSSGVEKSDECVIDPIRRLETIASYSYDEGEKMEAGEA
eukprot:Nitzschia sp. Nitz4//scaffold94_size78252//66575//72029//NITZ4_005477-RA/size78252-augustus-gene-0.74-mRNA-1//-1//CDS//3329560407//5991//frame0